MSSAGSTAAGDPRRQIDFEHVKPYADLRGVLLNAATRYRDDVVSGSYPDADHSYT